ncbi:MAG: hypothetical protein OJF49_001692 [Ktedonobacterales bacterium]|nr:MAG: hypothetical protein OJF49_001692 [Ktedonobacterales bacterium]
MSTMIDALKQAFDRAAQQSEEEQAALAAVIMQTLDDDAKWDALFADPLTPQALEILAAEALAEDDQTFAR